MNIRFFIERLKYHFDRLLEEDLIASNSENKDVLGNYEWTYLFSIVLYYAIKDYNESSRHTPQITVAPENGGRVPLDFTLLTRKNKAVLNIEHENSEDRIDKNFNKLLGKINKCPGLLIAYLGKNEDSASVVNRLKRKRTSKKIATKNKIHLLLGKYELDSSAGFIHSVI